MEKETFACMHVRQCIHDHACFQSMGMHMHFFVRIHEHDFLCRYMALWATEAMMEGLQPSLHACTDSH